MFRHLKQVIFKSDSRWARLLRFFLNLLLSLAGLGGLLSSSEMTQAGPGLYNLLSWYIAEDYRHSPFTIFHIVFAFLLLEKPNTRIFEQLPKLDQKAGDETLDGKDASLIKRCAQLSAGIYKIPWTFSFGPTFRFLKQIIFWPWRFFRLLLRSRILRPYLFREKVISGDGSLFNGKTAAFLLSTGIDPSDLHFASFYNNDYQTPFCIVTDHQTESIIVVFRGTTSVADFVTDASLQFEQMPIRGRYTFVRYNDRPKQKVEKAKKAGKKTIEDNNINSCLMAIIDPSWDYTVGHNRESLVAFTCNEDGYCLDTGLTEGNITYTTKRADEAYAHSGMYVSAHYAIPIVHRIVSQLLSQPQYQNYKLVTTGHSLGAGIASLLALMLRKRYPKVRCIAFSTPGCVVSKEALRPMNEFVTSIFVGNDFSPRLSIQTFGKHRRNLKNTLTKENVFTNFTAISTKEFVHWLIKGELEEHIDQDIERKELARRRWREAVLNLTILRIWASYQSFSAMRLFAPGRIIQLIEEFDRKKGEYTIKRCMIHTSRLDKLSAVNWSTICDHHMERVKRLVEGKPRWFHQLWIVRRVDFLRRALELYYMGS